jgi:isopentenyldiphosphate isomerase
VSGRSESTDPADEPFDVLNADGSPAGFSKPRAQVHRDGDWHRAFHLWLAWRGPDGEPHVLFQRRAPGKDTWPNRLDVAVGGHYRAGEGRAQVIREVGEELGIEPDPARVVRIGTRRVESLTERWVDREIQDVHVLLLDALPVLRPHPVELAAVNQVAVAALERLFAGEAETIETLEARVEPDGSLAAWRACSVTRDDFIPVRDDYWRSGTRAAVRLLTNRG